MLHLDDILPLTDFKRQTAAAVEHMHTTGRPLVLTVNGRAELVVHDAKAWQSLQDRLEQAEAAAGLASGLNDVARGDTVEIGEAIANLRQRHGLAR